MKFLIDTNPPRITKLVSDYPDFVAGQLIVPAKTRSNWGGRFAMDNSAFVSFDADRFKRLQHRQKPNAENCLFVACPDIVGNGRRTLELWKHREQFENGFDLSLVIQDGMEDLDLPWHETPSIFIGGCDPWKDSQACLDIVKTAKTLGKHVHIGRVNFVKRYRHFAGLADTCDGSGIALFQDQLPKLIREFKDGNDQPLFESTDFD